MEQDLAKINSERNKRATSRRNPVWEIKKCGKVNIILKDKKINFRLRFNFIRRILFFNKFNVIKNIIFFYFIIFAKYFM